MVSQQPLISIITCTRNSGAYLSNCLHSVKNQSYQDFEHIVIDGHSTDDTTSILKKIGLKPIQAAPRGISAAMNEGIRHATGKYLYFLHSDDSLYSKDTLKKVESYLISHQTFDWVYGKIHEMKSDGSTVGYPPRLPIFHHPHPWLLKYYNYIPHQAVFMKKEVFEKFGNFDTRLSSMMDDELWLRIAGKTSWGFMPIVVANYSIRTNSQSESAKNKQANDHEWSKVQKKYLNTWELVVAKAINSLLR